MILLSAAGNYNHREGLDAQAAKVGAGEAAIEKQNGPAGPFCFGAKMQRSVLNANGEQCGVIRNYY